MLNMGMGDRRVRGFIVAPLLAVLGIVAGPAGAVAFVCYAAAAVMAVTAASGFCPLYRIFGMRTGGSANA